MVRCSEKFTKQVSKHVVEMLLESKIADEK
jgi:hypothetical protein